MYKLLFSLVICCFFIQSANSQDKKDLHIVKEGKHYLLNGKKTSEFRIVSILSKENLPSSLLLEIQDSRRYKKIGTVSFITGLPLLGFGSLNFFVSHVLNSPPSYANISLGILGTGILLEIAAYTIKRSRLRHAKKAIDLYNQSVLN
jgi:hypothetical protein